MGGVARMKLRRVPFTYAQRTGGHWNEARPEFSQIVNAASLAMPYLEPYLIKTMREARPLITDPALAAALDLYCGQESAHYRQHRLFNDTLKTQGYRAVEAIEAQLAADYARLGTTKSLAFNLAYAEGFESMALAIGHMLIEDRVFLFGGSESGVASLVLWHFVEEIEHKNVAFDVFEHVVGGYGWRVAGLLYATGHIFWRTRSGYQALLKEDGLWRDLRSRLALAGLLLRIFSKLVPRMLRILSPRYHPGHVADPAWALAWARLFDVDATGAARLDTDRLSAPDPLPRPA
jgi:predicted metal-dependent hydrolase